MHYHLDCCCAAATACCRLTWGSAALHTTGSLEGLPWKGLGTRLALARPPIAYNKEHQCIRLRVSEVAINLILHHGTSCNAYHGALLEHHGFTRLKQPLTLARPKHDPHHHIIENHIFAATWQSQRLYSIVKLTLPVVVPCNS